MADRKDRGGSSSDKIDFTDRREVEAWLGEVDAYLDESDRAALAEEISRQFGRAPAGSTLESELERTEDGLSWVLKQIETQESDEVRLHLGHLRLQIIEDVEALRQRVSELELDRPDD